MTPDDPTAAEETHIEAIGADIRSQPIPNVWNGSISAPSVRSAAFRLGAAPIEPAA